MKQEGISIEATDSFKVIFINNQGESTPVDNLMVEDNGIELALYDIPKTPTESSNMTIAFFLDFSELPPEYQDYMGYFLINPNSSKFPPSDFIGGEVIIKIRKS